MTTKKIYGGLLTFFQRRSFRMKLNEEAIMEFKRLYAQEYQVELSHEQAEEYGTRIIILMKAVYGDDLPPAPIDNNRRKENN